MEALSVAPFWRAGSKILVFGTAERKEGRNGREGRR